VRWFYLLLAPFKFAINLPGYIRYAKKMRLFAVKAFYQDVKDMFGDGAITVVSKNDDGTEIIIKSIFQADADVIHVVNDQAVINSDVWKAHGLKVESVCKRMCFGAKMFSTVVPLFIVMLSFVQSYRTFELNNTVAISISVLTILTTLAALVFWKKFLSSYISRLPQKLLA